MMMLPEFTEQLIVSERGPIICEVNNGPNSKDTWIDMD